MRHLYMNYFSVHYLFMEDSNGNIVDAIPFCSDECHRQYCIEHNIEYNGWNGFYEGGDSRQYCANCGTYAGGGTGSDAPCDCMVHNVVVNRFLSDTGERCIHGNYIQLPARFVR